MKKIFVLFTWMFVGLGSLGCASHNHAINGRQIKSEIPAGIRVGIGSSEVKVGDKVGVFKSVCKSSSSARLEGSERCIGKKVGEAIVLGVIDHD